MLFGIALLQHTPHFDIFMFNEGNKLNIMDDLVNILCRVTLIKKNST